MRGVSTASGSTYVAVGCNVEGDAGAVSAVDTAVKAFELHVTDVGVREIEAW